MTEFQNFSSGSIIGDMGTAVEMAENSVSYRSLCMTCGQDVGLKYTTRETAPKDGVFPDGLCSDCAAKTATEIIAEQRDTAFIKKVLKIRMR